MRVLLTAMAFGCVASFASAQNGPPADWQKARETFLKAMYSADAQTWSQHVAEDFMVVEPDGSIRTKAQRIAEIKAAKPVAMPPTPDQKIRVYGDTVIETFSLTFDNAPPARVTAVYVKQSGQWKAASVQLTAITK